MKLTIGLGVVTTLMVGCSTNEPETALAPASPPVVTVTAPPSPSPEPEKTVLATVRGPFNGTCVLMKEVGTTDEVGLTQQTHWKFRPQGDQKLQLSSKSGGYTMKMDRSSPTKFYGTVRTASGWQFAYTLKIIRADSEDFAQTIEVVTHDTGPGGFGQASFLCHLRAGGTGGTGD